MRFSESRKPKARPERSRRAESRLFWLVCALAGCRSQFALPSVPGQSAGGVPCTAAAECASAACVEGICCFTPCAPDHTCARRDQPGRCVPREPGDKCAQAADCPTGFCTDGVCCGGACAGKCMTCRRPDRPGECVVEPDNSDDDKECGLCGACFGGECAPTRSGTDPNGMCGAGKVCGPDQRCGQPPGGECSRDEECGLGDCIAGRCRVTEPERVTVSPLTPSTIHRPRGIAAGRRGAFALLTTEAVVRDAYYVAQNDLLLVSRPPDGAWWGRRLADDPGVPPNLAGMFPAALLYLGESVLAVGYAIGASEEEPLSCGPRTLPCGVFATMVAPDGSRGRPESVFDSRSVGWLNLVPDGDGSAFAYVQDYTTVRAVHRERDSNGAFVWKASAHDAAFTPASMTWEPALLGGQPGVVLGDMDAEGDARLRLMDLKTGAERPLAVPDEACAPQIAGSSQGDAGETLVAILCDRQGIWLGTLRETATGEPAWTTVLVSDDAWYGAPAGVLHDAQGRAMPAVTLLAPSGLMGIDEIRLAWRLPDGRWQARQVFTAGGGRTPTHLDAEVGPDDVLGILVGSGLATGNDYVVPDQLDLVRVRY